MHSIGVAETETTDVSLGAIASTMVSSAEDPTFVTVSITGATLGASG